MSSHITFEEYQAEVSCNLPITQSSRPVGEHEECMKENQPLRNRNGKTNKNNIIQEKRLFSGFAAPSPDDDPFENFEETVPLQDLPENIQLRTNSVYMRAPQKTTTQNLNRTQRPLQTPSAGLLTHLSTINKSNSSFSEMQDSPSPIPVIRSILGKRVASPISSTPNTIPSNDDEDHTSKKQCSLAIASNRFKIADLPRSLQSLSQYVITDYKAVLATRCPFPDITEEQLIAGAAIVRGTKKLNVNIELADSLDMLVNIVIARDSNFRSDLRTKVIPLVTNHYSFNKVKTQKAIFNNRQLHTTLKNEDGFLFKHSNKHTGLYEHPILQATINDMWFQDSQSIGIKFEAYFTPFPLITLAIVLTTVEYVIDCWATGTYNREKQFTAKDYHDIYKKHIGTLTKVREHSSNAKMRLSNICAKLLRTARRHAGVHASPEFNILDEHHIAVFEQAPSSSDEDDENEESTMSPYENPVTQTSSWPPARKKRKLSIVGSDNETESGGNSNSIELATV
ncbi:hypothetical protein Clacol_004362 [Clathrus columnatus]|uniref:DUF6532 domain-containing protein n=1 Tax=Clathrus columnatus TaxID=1419009 RepID=A0AAV5AAT7_9AGAM|nr:hypothetical protein Clacol_004362 [Clathrus columnatus]